MHFTITVLFTEHIFLTESHIFSITHCSVPNNATEDYVPLCIYAL